MRALRRLFRSRSAPPGQQWVPVATLRQPEAEMIVAMLVQEGVPAYLRPLDVANVPALGVCQILVPAGRVIEARALADPMATADGGWE